MNVLDDDRIKQELWRAWLDSEPGSIHSHEEGGFILRAPDGSAITERWPRGAQNEILVPSHANGCRNGMPIIATFHTHRNPGPDFQQEPSLTDIRAVRDDPDLRHTDYEGEYIISAKTIYRVRNTGEVEVVGPISALLASRTQID